MSNEAKQSTTPLNDAVWRIIYDTPEGADVRPREHVATIDVSRLADAWGSPPEDWDLLGPEPDADEPLGIYRKLIEGGEHPGVYYTIERLDEDGGRYVAIDMPWREATLDWLGREALDTSVLHDAAWPERRALGQGAD